MIETGSTLGAVRWILVAVFIAGGAEKSQSILRRTSAWHPVMLQRPWSRRHAGLLMSIALIADLAVISALLVRPFLGGVMAGVLLVVYSAAGVGIYASGHRRCSCLLGAFEARSTTAFLTRNALLCAFAVWVATLSFVYEPGVSPGVGAGPGISVALGMALVSVVASKVRDQSGVIHAE